MEENIQRVWERNWRKKKRIFGVNNREEFKNDKSEEFIDIVVNTQDALEYFMDSSNNSVTFQNITL